MSSKQLKIGLEIHFSLKTKTKLFSGTPNLVNQAPNSSVSPLDLGYPGFFPVTNEKAVFLSLIAGYALDCDVSTFLEFDRKNYIYPDLPKGFQITQNRTPIAKNGAFNFFDKTGKQKKINFNFFSIEEDTAKLIYKNDELWMDFNRAGAPLIEVVTAPEFSNASDVVAFLKQLFNLFRWLEISDCEFEWGTVRVDVNISTKFTIKNKTIVHPKVEIKNLNTFKNIEKSITLEDLIQEKTIINGEETVSTTKNFNENTQELVTMRKKFKKSEYFFIREHNLSNFELSKFMIEAAKQQAKNELINYNKLLNHKKKLANIERLLLENSINLQKKFLIFIEEKIQQKTVLLFIQELIIPLKLNSEIFDEDLIILMQNFEKKVINLKNCKLIFQQKLNNKNLSIAGELKKFIKNNIATKTTPEQKLEIIKILTSLFAQDENLNKKLIERLEATTKYLIGVVIGKTKGKISPKNIIAEINEFIKTIKTN